MGIPPACGAVVHRPKRARGGPHGECARWIAGDGDSDGAEVVAATGIRRLHDPDGHGSPVASRIGGTRVEYLAATPCLEGLLLRIIGHPGITTSSTVAECKRALYDGKYVDWDHRTEAQAYAKSFPKELLVRRRGAIAQLNALLTELD